MTVTPLKIKKKANFVGRDFEQQQLLAQTKTGEAAITVVYGRRRIGKTELIEQTFINRNILKFEGIEGGSEAEQRALVMRQLSQYTNEPLLMQYKTDSWLDVFDAIWRYLEHGCYTLYFEEVQWLAAYRDDFIRQLKLAWDNQFRRNNQLILVLCGSSPSFMIQKILHAKSLYNRSQTEMHLQEFSIAETKQFLKKRSPREVMNAYLTLGGIPEYLKKLQTASSVFTGICEQSFMPDSYFTREYQRIFVSSLSATGSHYEDIIRYLSQQRFATREAIAKHVKLPSGGRLTGYLDELITCGFITKYTPYNLAENSNLARYRISDAYLQFYFTFIEPKQKAIAAGQFRDNPVLALKTEAYQQWLGYAFERFCINHHALIAKSLGFSAVQYRAGSFYNRATSRECPGYQIDLLFDRDDHVITVCEIKYWQRPVGSKVIESFERKLDHLPNKSNKTLHKVLISAEGADNALQQRHYFDQVLTLDDLM